MVAGLRRSDEAEVIHAFLREADSERWARITEAALLAAGGTRQLVDRPDFSDQRENAIRAAALRSSRGWGDDVGMFQGFPTEVDWWHGELEPPEVERLRYVNYSYWKALSGGSRRVIDVEATLRRRQVPDWLNEMGTDWCYEIAQEYASGLVIPDIIVLGTPDLSSLVVVEGHRRITGIALSGVFRQRGIGAFIGTSVGAAAWMP